MWTAGLIISKVLIRYLNPEIIHSQVVRVSCFTHHIYVWPGV